MAFQVASLPILASILAAWSPSSDLVARAAEGAESGTGVVNVARPAEREVLIGRYHLEKLNYVGAINRFKTVVTQYPNSAYAQEALARVTEAYLALGLSSEAQTSAAVLKRRFPDSQWLAYANEALKSVGLEPLEDDRSWISRALK